MRISFGSRYYTVSTCSPTQECIFVEWQTQFATIQQRNIISSAGFARYDSIDDKCYASDKYIRRRIHHVSFYYVHIINYVYKRTNIIHDNMKKHFSISFNSGNREKKNHKYVFKCCLLHEKNEIFLKYVKI